MHDLHHRSTTTRVLSDEVLMAIILAYDTVILDHARNEVMNNFMSTGSMDAASAALGLNAKMEIVCNTT